jgi:carboxylesterase type B
MNSYYGTHLSGLEQNQFLGIPYASAPRFARPISLNETWNGLKNATSFGYSCVQVKNFGATNMGEDCLNLNVWTPTGAQNLTELPVLLWIYGVSIMLMLLELTDCDRAD